MSLSTFKNRLYNTIIAVALVVAIVTVSTYVPDIVTKTKETRAGDEIKYEEAQVRVESAKKYLLLSQSAIELENAGEKSGQRKALDKLKRVISDTKESVRKETSDAKKRTASVEIKNRADEYNAEVTKGLDKLSDMAAALSDKMDTDTLSEKAVHSEIEAIKSEIGNMQAYDTPDVKYNDEAHGNADGYEAKKITDEQPVKSKMHTSSAAPQKEENSSYLELNDEIKELADSFTTPAQVYEYVRNNYRYKQYTGLRLGAVGTYEQREGNDLDQAALLAALFRYKGYQAGFVIGNVDIDIDKAMNWLGVKTEKAAVRAMSMLGVPTYYGQDENGNITKIRIEHAWVKVLVPYDSYRGAGKVQGEKIWIELDPSFKQYEEETENNRVRDLLNSEAEKFSVSEDDSDWKEKLSGIEFSDIFNYEAGYDENSFAEIQSDIEEYLSNNDVDIKEVGSAVGIRYIEKDETGYLPAALPYDVVSRTYDEEYLSDNMRDRITLSVQSALYGTVFSGEPDAEISFYTADLYGHKIALTYKPATDEDKKIIDGYGSLFSTPSYLVRVTPVITVDGKQVLEGSAQIPGTYTNLIMNIDEAGIDAVKVENPLIAGGIYGITFDYNVVNENSMDSKYEELQGCVDELQSGETGLTEATAVLVNATGEAYFSYLDYYTRILAEAYDVQWGRCISECIVGYMPKQSTFMGIPTAISDGTMYIDVDTDTAGVAYNREENVEKDSDGYVRTNAGTKDFTMTGGIMASYLEGYIVGEMTGTQGISAVSVIQEARMRGIDIITLSGENRDELNSLAIDTAAKSEIENALNNGKVVIVPGKNICYYSWQGTGYIILNAETGEAAYMISGSLCGGQSAEELGWTIFTIIIAVVAVFTLCMYAHFLWSAIYAITSIVLGMNAGISILDVCIVILSIAGAVFSIVGVVTTGVEALKFALCDDIVVGLKLILEAFEVGIMTLIFAKALPVLMKFINARFHFSESKFFEFISKKWGGKDINLPDIVRPVKPGGDPSEPGGDPNPDPNPNPDPGPDVTPGGMGKDFWKKVAEKYGTDIAEKLKVFGDDGKRLIQQYGDDLADIVGRLSDTEVKQAVELINEYGDDAVELFKEGKSISQVKVALKGGGKPAEITPVKETNMYADYLNPSGEIVRIPKQSGKSIDQAIAAKLKSTDIGDIVEAKVANYVKQDLGIELTEFCNKIKDNTNAILGEIDCATENVLIEVIASIASVKLNQFYKYVDSSNSEYLNVFSKKVVLYIDEPIGELTNINKQLIEDIKALGVEIVNSLDELKGIFN